MIRKMMVSGLFIVATAGWASAQSPSDIDRLRAALAHRPEEQTVDTALIFTNLGRDEAVVNVQAFNSKGEPAGRATVNVPGKGLAYVLASDLRGTAEELFLGHAEAVSRDVYVLGTAVLLGAGTTDLPVHRRVQITEPPPVARPGTGAPPSVRFVKLIFPTVAAY